MALAFRAEVTLSVRGPSTIPQMTDRQPTTPTDSDVTRRRFLRGAVLAGGGLAAATDRRLHAERRGHARLDATAGPPPAPTPSTGAQQRAGDLGIPA